MSEPLRLTIKTTPEAMAILARISDTGGLLGALAAASTYQNQLTIAHITRQHLTGTGPFPPSEHKLGVRTNRLRSALWASPATVTGNEIHSQIGDNVRYAKIHEFGGVIKHKARSGSVRLHTNARGELLRQDGHAHLAVFAKGSHKDSRVRTVKYNAAAYEVHMPARAPIWTGIQERGPAYCAALGKAASKFLTNK